jgi:hypothetical protein
VSRSAIAGEALRLHAPALRTGGFTNMQQIVACFVMQRPVAKYVVIAANEILHRRKKLGG